MKKKSIITLVIYLALLGLFFAWVTGAFAGGGDDLPYSGVVKLLKGGQVKSFEVEDRVIRLELHNPYNGKTSLTSTLADVEQFRQEMADVIQQQLSAGTLESCSRGASPKGEKAG